MREVYNDNVTVTEFVLFVIGFYSLLIIFTL
jgi:hypothetical protein